MILKIKKFGMLLLLVVLFVRCSKDECALTTKETIFQPQVENKPPTATEFKALRDQGLKKNTQIFTAVAGKGFIDLVSSKGVKIGLMGDTFFKNGAIVVGQIEVTYVELFDKGNMLITNKPTMGLMDDGKKALLKSGGEFFLKATQGDEDLIYTGQIRLDVPASLTGGLDNEMTFWVGNTKDEENLVWANQKQDGTTTQAPGLIRFGRDNYLVTFGNFGWTNIDKFYSDSRPRTTILATVPGGYDNSNCAIYLSYDGEGQNALAKLDTYNASTKEFSEHYGQIPIGLACHVIFVTEDDGNWRYAIKKVTVAAGDVYNFSLTETTTGTEAQLVAAINAIQ